MPVAPTFSSGSKNSPSKFSEPWNIRCSKRWAKPVLPGFSFLLPTWYQTLTATIGALWSSWTTSVSPFWRTNFWNSMFTVSAIEPDLPAIELALSAAGGLAGAGGFPCAWFAASDSSRAAAREPRARRRAASERPRRRDERDMVLLPEWVDRGDLAFARHDRAALTFHGPSRDGGEVGRIDSGAGLCPRRARCARAQRLTSRGTWVRCRPRAGSSAGRGRRSPCSRRSWAR